MQKTEHLFTNIYKLLVAKFQLFKRYSNVEFQSDKRGIFLKET